MKVVFENGGFYFGQAVVCGLSAFCCLYAFYNWLGFHKSSKKFISLPQVCLGLEICSNIFRFIYLIDPWFTHGFYIYWISVFLASISSNFTYTSTLLILFFWRDAMSGYNLQILSWIRSKYTASIIITMLFSIDFLINLLTSINIIYFDAYLITYLLFQILYSTVIGMIVVVTGRKLMKIINISPKDTKITRLITLSGISMIFKVIFALMIIITITLNTLLLYTPLGIIMVIIVFIVLDLFTSLAQITTFSSPN